jgi:hypothetical protein
MNTKSKGVLRHECGRVSSAAPTLTEPGGEPAFPMLARTRRRASIELERDEVAAGRERARQPDRAVAAERANLEDSPRAQHLGQQVQQLAMIRSTRRCREPRAARRQRGIERRVE